VVSREAMADYDAGYRNFWTRQFYDGKYTAISHKVGLLILRSLQPMFHNNVSDIKLQTLVYEFRKVDMLKKEIASAIIPPEL
jgi:hypothetical protein